MKPYVYPPQNCLQRSVRALDTYATNLMDVEIEKEDAQEVEEGDMDLSDADGDDILIDGE